MEQGSSGISFDQSIEHEWLSTNGIGGYASSTTAGCNTRKYHGLLVAALTPPLRRMVLLSRVEETITYRGWPHPLATCEYPGTIHPEGHLLLRAFNHEPFPRWGYQGDGWTLMKQLHLIKGQNTACLRYILVGNADDVTLELRPLLALRPIHDLMYQWSGRPPVEPHDPGQWRITPTRLTPEAFFAHDGEFIAEPYWYFNTIYRLEKQRGYRGLEDLWMPGTVRWRLQPGQFVNFIISTEPIDREAVLRAVEVEDVPAAPLHGLVIDTDDALTTLTRAAEQFVLDLPEDNPVPAILTGYHWGAPNVREALIGFAGLFLATGKFDQARRLLLTLAGHLRDGLLPSEFDEDGSGPRYGAADPSLWFAQAVYDYLRYTHDERTVLDRFLPVLQEIVQHYNAGTRLGITVAEDGLLGAADASASWMNARVLGKLAVLRLPYMVEINALWYNALRITAELSAAAGQQSRASALSELATRQQSAFNRRFWNEADQGCYDSLSGTAADESIRPNQLLAISLAYPVLDLPRHAAVLKTMQQHLLTPLGLRTLSPQNGRYLAHKGGDVSARDRARHNGPAYPWLLGHYISALVRLKGHSQATRDEVAALLQPCIAFMRSHCGQLPELFDGTAPHAPGGAIASAAGVGELLRAYTEDVLDHRPEPRTDVLPPAIEVKIKPVNDPARPGPVL